MAGRRGAANHSRRERTARRRDRRRIQYGDAGRRSRRGQPRRAIPARPRQQAQRSPAPRGPSTVRIGDAGNRPRGSDRDVARTKLRLEATPRGSCGGVVRGRRDNGRLSWLLAILAAAASAPFVPLASGTTAKTVPLALAIPWGGADSLCPADYYKALSYPATISVKGRGDLFLSVAATASASEPRRPRFWTSRRRSPSPEGQACSRTRPAAGR